MICTHHRRCCESVCICKLDASYLQTLSKLSESDCKRLERGCQPPGGPVRSPWDWKSSLQLPAVDQLRKCLTQFPVFLFTRRLPFYFHSSVNEPLESGNFVFNKEVCSEASGWHHSWLISILLCLVIVGVKLFPENNATVNKVKED